jgi:hypothetical protein
MNDQTIALIEIEIRNDTVSPTIWISRKVRVDKGIPAGTTACDISLANIDDIVALTPGHQVTVAIVK